MSDSWFGVSTTDWLRRASTATAAACIVYYMVSRFTETSDSDDSETPNGEESRQDEIVASSDFERAVMFLNKNKGASPSTNDQLELYGLYKQATAGDCDRPKPSAVDFAGSAKWTAWNERKGTPVQEAESLYVAKVGSLYPDWCSGGSSMNGPSAGSGKPDASNAFGVGTTSTTQFSMGCTNEEEEEEGWREGSDVFYYASTGDLKSLVYSIRNGEDVNSQDEEERTPLHWAADRGHLEMVTELLKLGADPNKQDMDGSTPLGYAVVCEFADIVKVLMSNGADPSIADVDGITPLGSASQELKQLLS